MEKPLKQESTPNPVESAMRFLRRNPPPDLRGKPGDGGGNKTATDEWVYSQNQVPYEFKRQRAFNPMSADRFGEELAQDAAIWSVYLEEAKEHDNELVSSRQQSLDTLLLFAGLFSAVLTAFIVESKSLLQPDPADVSVSLLLTIAQSQQRLELGLPAPRGTTIPVNIPKFEPSWSARWVNGIWFTSLGLSLSVALIAMLGKEWLASYLTSRPRSERKLAFIRQSRLQGLEDWWALHIIAILPTLLHISLLLFSVGLVIYLWDYDVAVAAVLAGVIGVTLLFYIVTGILGAIFEFCPFVTEVSEYTRRAAVVLFAFNGGDHNDSAAPIIQILKALLWLASNARDSEVVDCAYQAMSGLNPSSYIKSTDFTAQIISDVDASVDQGLLPYIYREETLASLLETVSTRFDELLSGTLETGTGDLPISRYMNTMLGLTRYIYKLPIKTPISWFDLLNKVDSIWSSNLPPGSMSGNTFAHVLITKQELMQLVAGELEIPTDSTTQPNILACVTNDGTLDIPRRSTPIINNGHVINMRESSDRDQKNLVLQDIFAQWVNMAVELVLNCSRGEVSIDPYRLEALSKAMGDAADFLDRNTPNQRFEPASGNVSLNRIGNLATNSNVHINADRPPISYRNSLDILGPLVSSLNCSKGGSKPIAAHVCNLKIYSMVMPITLRHLHSSEIDIEKVRQLLKFRDLESRPPVTRWDVLFTTVCYAMITAGQTCKLMARHPKSIKIFDDTLDAVYYAAQAEGGYDFEHGGPLGAIGCHFGDYISILMFATENESNFSLITSNSAENLCIIATHQLANNTYPCAYYVPPLCAQILLPLLAGTEQLYASTIRCMLEALINRIRTPSTDISLPRPYSSILAHPPIEYLQQWTHSGQSFSSLMRTALKNSTYIQPVLDCLTAVILLAANRDPKLNVEPIELRTAAICGFLQAIAWALPHLSSRPGEAENYRGFVDAVATLLAKAAEDPASREILVNDRSLNPLFNELESGKGKDIGKLSQEEWEAIAHKLAEKTPVGEIESEESSEESDESDEDEDSEED